MTPLAPGYPGPVPLPAEISERFCYPPATMSAKLTLVEETPHYRLYNGSFPSGLPDGHDRSPISFEYYSQPGRVTAPVIMVLPILNARKHVARLFAGYFAQQGYAAVIVDTNSTPPVGCHPQGSRAGYSSRRAATSPSPRLDR